MNHSMVEKQALILHPCHFTRQGIRHLLPPAYRVFDTGNLEIFTRWLLTCGSIDLVVIRLSARYPGGKQKKGTLNEKYHSNI
ncbi:hypothetical protein [Serratia fonticola]|uniref:hypothetical protein n=1 Tax=Serratia fonticola TaxID=47917 RepID=UPI003AAD5B6C